MRRCHLADPAFLTQLLCDRCLAVDDFELLSDCKATATLQLRPGAALPNWDSEVSAFVDSL